MQARAGSPYCCMLDALGPPCLSANVMRKLRAQPLLRADSGCGRRSLVTIRLAVRRRRGAAFQGGPIAHSLIVGHRCCRHTGTPSVWDALDAAETYGCSVDHRCARSGSYGVRDSLPLPAGLSRTASLSGWHFMGVRGYCLVPMCHCRLPMVGLLSDSAAAVSMITAAHEHGRQSKR